ncbi:hypothetical protein [Stieleria tagensis]|uniref:hypothetical protein n=1 Tax=Stieleria tagensis TaxID=2956795 RepID=UPI00209B136F|nr:hypothetical protein [Stieleria tagensis]
MVATIAAVLSMSALSVKTAKAQVAGGPSAGGMQLPSSLSGAARDAMEAFGQQVQAAANSTANSAPISPQLRGFVGGSNTQSGAGMTGGPSTEPTGNRDSIWLTDSMHSGSERPSTNPVSSTSRSAGFPGTTAQQPNYMRGNVSTVSGTQDPSGSTAASGPPAGSAPLSKNFGSLPDGVNLPPRALQSGQQSTFSNDYSNNQMTETGGHTASGQPQFGPLTAAQAAQRTGQSSFDPSAFNTNSPSVYGNQNSSGLGMPSAGQSTAAVTNSLGRPGTKTNWTAAEIAALGGEFGIPPNDPRLQDEAYVNQLHKVYQDSLAKQQAPSPTNRWGTPSSLSMPGATASDSLQMPGSVDPRLASRPGMGMNSTVLPPTLPETQSTAASKSRRTEVDSRLSQADIDRLPVNGYSFDKYGNPIDRDRYILDRFGERVDDETSYELTIGRKRKEAQARIAKENAASGDHTPILGPPTDPVSLSDRTASNPGRPGQFTTGQLVAAGGGVAPPNFGNSSSISANRPPQPPESGEASAPGKPHSSDSADGGLAPKSNPYVNIFLLCSLVANGFLFVWLHRLWHHHRDLIASSRMAASGISTVD